MVGLLGLRSLSFGYDASPREITRTRPLAGDGSDSPISPFGAGGENGWLIRFFDSAFFCEWIAVSYLYKHEHAGVRDYLCNRMYTLPLSGIENYLFQICYMLVHKPSPSLDKFVIDTCSKSLRIALKVHWFLLAELEDSEDNEGISRIQEKSQIAATLMGEWPPLVRPPPPPPANSPASPIGNAVLTRILSSKQKLLSLTSSPALGSSPPADDGTRALTASEENKLFRKLIPGPKMRDALFFRKSMEREKEMEEDGSEKDGFFKRLLRDSKDKEDYESEKDGFFKRLLRDSKEREEEEQGKEGFFKRLLSKDREEEDSEKDGFFRRLLSNKHEEEELIASSEGFLKKLFRDKDEKSVEEDEKENFFQRIFKDNNDEKKDTGQSRNDKSEEKKDAVQNRNEEDDKISRGIDFEEKENFFRRIFKDKNEDRKDAGHMDDEREGFFRRIFKEKNDDKRINGNDKSEEGDKVSRSIEEDEVEKDNLFHRIFKDKGLHKKDGHSRNEEEDQFKKSTEDDTLIRRLFKDKSEDKKNEEEDKLKKNAADDNIIRRLFKDKNEEKKYAAHDRNEDYKCNVTIEEAEKDGFFRRFFKDKHNEKKNVDFDRNEEDSKGTWNLEEDDTSEFLSFRRLFRVHPEESRTQSSNKNGISSSSFDGSPGTENFFRRLFRDREQSLEDSELIGPKTKTNKEKQHGSPRQRNEKSHGKPPLPNSVVAEMRKGSYHASLEFVQTLCDTSYGLVDIFPTEDRKISLRESLTDVNQFLAAAQKSGGVCFPMGKGMYRVVNIPEDEAVLLNSREKAPYLICIEVLKCESPSHTKAVSDSHKPSRAGIPLANGDAQLPKPPPWAYPLWSQPDMNRYDHDGMLRSTSEAIDQAMAHLWEAKVKFVNVSFSVERKLIDRSKTTEESGSRENIQQSGNNREIAASTLTISNVHELEWINVSLSAIPGVNMEDVDDQEPSRKKDHRRVPSTIAIEEVKAAAAKGQTPPGLPLKGPRQNLQEAELNVVNEDIPKPTDALCGELWEAKKLRIRMSSAHGRLPGWDLCSMIVKSGDDCRQEHLAAQLVSHFYDIYQEAGLPLWLHPYEVLVTSSYTALIETIPDTASIHSIKSRFPNITSLRDFYIAKYGENSQNFRLAQRNFVESMAGYSILCYLIQLKDRHNGNILIDEEGHIIHIDYGFMLSNSPGGVNFESAPFKLTRELLEVMDSDAEGTPSEFFDYFKVLCIQGFLTCRKHAERIILLVEMLQDSGFPCFKGGPRTIQNLRKRFHLSLTEEQCVSLVLSLISSSLDAWRTRQYDYYQRVLNGIL